MMTRPRALALSAALLALATTAGLAQTQLPGIVVVTPSPITPPAAPQAAPSAQQPSAPPKKASASQQGVPAKKSQPAAAPAQPAQPVAAPPDPTTSLPGTILVASDAFAAVTVVTARDIQSTPGATLTDTLQTRPGIVGSTFAPGANRPVVRGLDNYRVRVQENGIGSHDVSALSEDHAVPIDPFSADRVEVVRGPATLRYGSGAIGGVVAATNSRIPDMVPPHGLVAELRGGFNSVDEGRDGAFSVTAGAGNFAVHADAFRRRADDYDTPQGRQLNSYVESDGFALGASYVWRHGFAGVAFTRFSSLYGIPGGEAAELNKRIDLEQDKVTSRGEWRAGSFGVEAIRYWLGFSDYAHSELVEEGEVGARFTNREREGRVEVQHLPVGTMFGELRGAVGVQWGHRRTRGQSFEGDSLLEPATNSMIAAFWFEELQMTSRLRLQAALRIEDNRSVGIGLADVSDPLAPQLFDGERRFRPTSTSLGLLYELPLGVVARVTGQYVERAPDIGELFSKGAHEATETFEIGNPFLTKEKAQSFEVGLRRAKGDLRFDASLFRTHFQGFIFKRLTGVDCGATLDTCGVEDELQQLVFEQRDAIFHGAEIAIQYDIAPIWRGVWGVEGQYDYVHAHFIGDGNVPRIPPHRLGGGLYYRSSDWFARVNALHAFRQDRIADNETPTSGYTLVGAELSRTIRQQATAGIGQELTIGIRAENLLDDDVRNHVSFKKDEVLQPGRTIRLFGSLKFN